MASFLIGGPIVSAQVNDKSNLQNQILQADSLLFEEAFNQCHLKILDSLLHPQLEFLHDQSGRQDYSEFLGAIRKNICAGQGPKPIRQLIEGSTAIYPLNDQGKLYGAIQTGSHLFYLREADGSLRATSKAHFTHTWLLVEEKWQLYQVLSYDHHEPE